MKKENFLHEYILFITGPTASGKTELSLQLANLLKKRFKIGSQVINADTGQFYTPLKIGTAKPDWKNLPIKHHFFDILHEPEELNVVSYRSMVNELLRKIWDEGNLPIFVGGSLFYIRSLFFPPVDEYGKEHDEENSRFVARKKLSDEEKQALWDKLNRIDPERAAFLHPHDVYRIQRALSVWERTGKKPSELQPVFEPICNARLLFIDLDREVLYERINRRTDIMLQECWIEEAKRLKETSWEDFLMQKKLIGYPEIFEWLNQGEKKDQISHLAAIIKQKTRNYAKRQITFWKKFRKLLEQHAKTSRFFCSTRTINNIDNTEIEAILELIRLDLKRLS